MTQPQGKTDLGSSGSDESTQDTTAPQDNAEAKQGAANDQSGTSGSDTPPFDPPPCVWQGRAILWERLYHLTGVNNPLVELRATGVRFSSYSRPGIKSGYYDEEHRAQFIREALRTTQSAKGVYRTLNRVDPALHARKYNRAERADGATTSDDDITRRLMLFVDLDPVRPADVSSSDAEHQAAIAKAFEIRDRMREEFGWPDPIVIDSGNGANLLYALDLPIDDELEEHDRDIIKRTLAAMGDRFDTVSVKVDRGVYNLARIAKVPGTWARKGDNARERPHRRCVVLAVPGVSDPNFFRPIDVQHVPVSIELLRAFVAESEPQKDEKGTSQSSSDSTHSSGNSHYTEGGSNPKYNHRLLVPAYLAAVGQEVKQIKTLSSGTTAYLLAECPFNPQHGKTGEVGVYQRSGGAMSFHCMHDSCSGNNWYTFRDRVGKPLPTHYDPPLKSKASSGASGGSSTAGGSSAGADSSYCWEFCPITTEDFLKGDFKPIWAVTRFIALKQPCLLGGPKKSLKTNLLVELAVSLATQEPFLGAFEVPRRLTVALLSGESGQHTLQETLRRICRAKGIGPELAKIYWEFRLPQLANPTDMSKLTAGMKDRGIEVAILDPLYLSLLAGQQGKEFNAASLYDMGPLLLGVTKACLDVGVTPIIAHHTKKHTQPGEPIELDDLAFAGVAEFARQWVFVNRRERYVEGTGHHQLWLTAGGSLGHGGLWGLDIHEGVIDENFEGRTWEVTVTPGSELREQQRAARKDTRDAKAEDKVERDTIALITQLDRMVKETGQTAIGIRALRVALAWGPDRIDKAIARLKQQGLVEEVPVVVPSGHGGKTTTTAKGIRRKRD